jgi:hypothetical protein
MTSEEVEAHESPPPGTMFQRITEHNSFNVVLQRLSGTGESTDSSSESHQVVPPTPKEIGFTKFYCTIFELKAGIYAPMSSQRLAEAQPPINLQNFARARGGYSEQRIIILHILRDHQSSGHIIVPHLGRGNFLPAVSCPKVA